MQKTTTEQIKYLLKTDLLLPSQMFIAYGTILNNKFKKKNRRKITFHRIYSIKLVNSIHYKHKHQTHVLGSASTFILKLSILIVEIRANNNFNCIVMLVVYLFSYFLCFFSFCLFVRKHNSLLIPNTDGIGHTD